jgi:hypothetical protein
MANDAERARPEFVLNTVSVSMSASIAAGRMINSLAQTLFPIKPNPARGESLVMEADPFYIAATGKTRVTISVSFSLI